MCGRWSGHSRSGVFLGALSSFGIGFVNGWRHLRPLRLDTVSPNQVGKNSDGYNTSNNTSNDTAYVGTAVTLLRSQVGVRCANRCGTLCTVEGCLKQANLISGTCWALERCIRIALDALPVTGDKSRYYSLVNVVKGAIGDHCQSTLIQLLQAPHQKERCVAHLVGASVTRLFPSRIRCQFDECRSLGSIR